MGKYNFTERWKKRFKEKKDKTFSQRIINKPKENVQRNSSNSREKENWLSSSEKEHKVNALASGAEEGRDKLRKAAGSCK